MADVRHEKESQGGGIRNQDDKNAAEGSMEPGSGLIFVGDGEQLVKKLILNWEHGANYPSLIENNNLSVEELKFILNVYPGRWYFFSFPFDVNVADVTHDGKVTPSDAIMILYRFFNVQQTGFNARAADVNGDNNITPSDAIEALYIFFGADRQGSETPEPH